MPGMDGLLTVRCEAVPPGVRPPTPRAPARGVAPSAGDRRLTRYLLHGSRSYRYPGPNPLGTAPSTTRHGHLTTLTTGGRHLVPVHPELQAHAAPGGSCSTRPCGCRPWSGTLPVERHDPVPGRQYGPGPPVPSRQARLHHEQRSSVGKGPDERSPNGSRGLGGATTHLQRVPGPLHGPPGATCLQLPHGVRPHLTPLGASTRVDRRPRGKVARPAHAKDRPVTTVLPPKRRREQEAVDLGARRLETAPPDVNRRGAVIADTSTAASRERRVGGRRPGGARRDDRRRQELPGAEALSRGDDRSASRKNQHRRWHHHGRCGDRRPALGPNPSTRTSRSVLLTPEVPGPGAPVDLRGDAAALSAGSREGREGSVMPGCSGVRGRLRGRSESRDGCGRLGSVRTGAIRPTVGIGGGPGLGG